jgi:chloramphenicol 3-O phosphotransferase
MFAHRRCVSAGKAVTVTKGNIILLNGTSSSGKSKLARSLQAALGQAYFHLDLDLFQPTWPPGFLVYGDGQNSARVEGFLAVFREESLIEVRIGPAGFRYMDGIFQAIAGWASMGNNLIVDGVIHHPQVLRAAVQALQTFPVLFVGVRCPLEVAEGWERARGNRARGGARAFHNLVHTHGIYDLEVDSSRHTADEGAFIIRAAMKIIIRVLRFNTLPRHWLDTQPGTSRVGLPHTWMSRVTEV